MTSSRRAAFTVVDLGAVISVVGILMSLGLPVLGNSREDARRVDCAHRMRQVARAGTGLYPDDFRSFPGYWMPANAEIQTGTTWPLILARYLERADLWNAWKEGKVPPSLYWDQVVCPSNMPKKTDAHWLSFAVNCALYGNNKNRANGICFDQLSKPAGPKTSPESVLRGKGCPYTLFASENTLGIVSSNTAGWLQTTPAGALQYTGFCWQAVNTPNAVQQINGDMANQKPPMAKTALADYARPASNHPGGVNVAFCDGHVKFLSERVAYSVYQVLMASEPANADFPPSSPAIG